MIFVLENRYLFIADSDVCTTEKALTSAFQWPSNFSELVNMEHIVNLFWILENGSI